MNLFIIIKERKEKSQRPSKRGLNQKSYKHAHAHFIFKKRKKQNIFLAGGFDLSLFWWDCWDRLPSPALCRSKKLNISIHPKS